jgi:hypothetical protein
MKIDAAGFAPLLAPTTGGGLHAARWRQTLEAAMWQSRPSVPPSGGEAAKAARGPEMDGHPGPTAAASAATPAATPAALLPAGLPGPGTATPPATPPSPAQPSRAAAADAAHAREPAAANPERPVHSPPVPQSVAWAPPGPVRDAPTAAAAPPTAPAPPRAWAPPATTWTPFASHASVQGDVVSASLRDARLGDHEAADLRRALERRLAGSGLRLAELRVNGQLIADPYDRS